METGEPWGVPTDTWANTLGDAWYKSRYDLLDRNDFVQDTRYGLTPLALSRPQRVAAFKFSKLPFMSRKSAETFLPAICGVFTSWVRVVTASEADRPASEPHWWGLRRPVAQATHESLEFIMVLRVFEKVWSKTMMWKGEGEASEGLPGLSITMPSALLRVRRWDP